MDLGIDEIYPPSYYSFLIYINMLAFYYEKLFRIFVNKKSKITINYTKKYCRFIFLKLPNFQFVLRKPSNAF
mgnify:CR=1 FL=1